MGDEELSVESSPVYWADKDGGWATGRRILEFWEGPRGPEFGSHEQTPLKHPLGVRGWLRERARPGMGPGLCSEAPQLSGVG